MSEILLEIRLKKLRHLAPDPAWLLRSRKALEGYLEAHPIAFARPAIFWLTGPIASAALVVLLVFLGAGATIAAQGSLPNEPLYPIKLASEEVREILAVTQEQKAETQLAFAKRRLEEAAALLAQPGVETDVIKESLLRFSAQVEDAKNLIGELDESGEHLLALRLAEKLESASEAKARAEEQIASAVPRLGELSGDIEAAKAKFGSLPLEGASGAFAAASARLKDAQGAFGAGQYLEAFRGASATTLEILEIQKELDIVAIRESEKATTTIPTTPEILP